MRDFILASGSSRRHSLIDRLNLEYRVCVSNVDESVVDGELPEEYVCRMAREKAQAVAHIISQANSQIISQSNSQSLTVGQVILAADTIIALSGEILGKPKNVQHAKNILQKLSDTEHEVLTALHLKTEESELKMLVRSSVKFKLLNDNEIDAYCLTTEPYDKAGAYAIQGGGAAFVEYLSGSYTNVVGLPLFAVYELLKNAKFSDLNRYQ